MTPASAESSGGTKVTVNIKPMPAAKPRPAAGKGIAKPKVSTRSSAGKNKELEDTLKKLREMSK